MSAYDNLVQMWVQTGSTLEEAKAAAAKVYPSTTPPVRTDHSRDIANLRARAAYETNLPLERLALLTAADLLEIHDATGLSLDNWPAARGLVEHLTHHRITENDA